MCGVFFGGIGGWVGEGKGRDLVVPIVGTMAWCYYKRIIISFLCTNDNPLVIAPGWNNEISFPLPSPHPTTNTHKTPRILV